MAKRAATNGKAHKANGHPMALPGVVAKSLALNSCELHLNFRGEVSVAVKVYDANEAEAVRRARVVFDDLRKTYRNGRSAHA